LLPFSHNAHLKLQLYVDAMKCTMIFFPVLESIFDNSILKKGATMKKSHVVIVAVVVFLSMIVASCGGGGGSAPAQVSNTWDSAKWDTAVWGP